MTDKPEPAPVDPKLLDLLVCPLTKGPLRYDRERQELVSEQAGLAYPIRDGIPIMLVDEARPLDEDDAIPEAVRPRPAAPEPTMTAEAGPWPTELRVDRAAKRLTVTFDDGERFVLPAELLRVESPSAEVQGHGPSQKTIVAGRRHVGIMDLEPVGNYAVRIRFDDLHDTGMYSWRYLYHLGKNQERLWADYLAALEQRGLSRDP